MSDLMKDLGDACMCGEQFYGRPCLWCKAKERIAELSRDFYELEIAQCYKGNSIRHWYNKAQAYGTKMCEFKADNERLRAALERIADSGVILNGQFSWIVDEAKEALKGG